MANVNANMANQPVGNPPQPAGGQVPVPRNRWVRNSSIGLAGFITLAGITYAGFKYIPRIPLLFPESKDKISRDDGIERRLLFDGQIGKYDIEIHDAEENELDKMIVNYRNSNSDITWDYFYRPNENKVTKAIRTEKQGLFETIEIEYDGEKHNDEITTKILEKATEDYLNLLNTAKKKMLSEFENRNKSNSNNYKNPVRRESEFQKLRRYHQRNPGRPFGYNTRRR